MQINKKKATATGVGLAMIGFLARKERRDELKYWMEYQANRVSMIIKNTKGMS